VLLFLRVQRQDRDTHSSTIECLADVLAQTVFLALHMSFPNSRHRLTDSLRGQLLRQCHGWFGGFVPDSVGWDHWVPYSWTPTERKSKPVDHDSLMRRIERKERVSKLMKKGRMQAELSHKAHERRERRLLEGETGLPEVPESLQVRSRVMYALGNSPLVTQHLAKGVGVPQTGTRPVRLRLTSDASDRMRGHNAPLVTPGALVERRRGCMEPDAPMLFVRDLRKHHRQLHQRHERQRNQFAEESEAEGRACAAAHQSLQRQQEAALASKKSIRAISNVLTRGARRESARDYTKYASADSRGGGKEQRD
jgi:hypothetical protein